MKRILISILLVFIVSSLFVSAFAADSQRVQYGLYDDHFIFEGVSYSFSPPSSGLVPTFMYLVGNELSIVFRSPNSSPFVIIAGDGKLTYYDADGASRLIYYVTDSVPTYSWTSNSRRIDSPSVDHDVFRSHFLVSIHDIYFAPDYNGGALFSSAEPQIFYDDVVTEPDYNGDITDFFVSLFSGLAFVFETTPMVYLFGILILAFIIFIFKMIFRH